MNSKKIEEGIFEVNVGPIKRNAECTGISNLGERFPAALEKFNARAERGGVRAELGHPTESVHSPELTEKRAMAIDEQYVCASISSAQIRDDELFLRGHPEGPYGDLLAEAMDNPGGPAFFGMRAFWSGDLNDMRLNIVTWDVVSGKP
ncbi:S80 family phage morphogenetic serine protease [Pandoraea soli]|uniref:Uncharacterized protein n=1 Tax=Pandoraea soli TaxID=2508293 RepID=A0ABY6W2P6_9BURK|nr:S80 family phage morphogenetic serine protease [Pandoraea soli]VVE16036.1 hypothetical protein PSO31014_02871 [Pandoraea soli]